jgi:MATE family multidrug resistance protein
MVIAMWSIVPALVALSLRSFAIVLEQSGTVMVATILAAVANACLNWVFIYGNLGAPALRLQGAALATVGAHVLGALWLVGWSSRHALAKRYTLFQRFHVPDRDAFREVLRLGFPMGATVLAEVTLFYAASLMMGWISVLALAAHGIAIQIASMAFMIPLGLSSAATVRIGLARGRDDHANLARAAHAAIMVAGGFAVVTASIMWLAPGPLAALFLSPDNPQTPAVIAAAVPLIMVAAVFQLVDAMQATGAGLLRGLKDTRVPMIIAIASYWLVGLPTAYLLAFTLGYGGVGVWSGLATGLAAAAIAMNWRFARRKSLGLM